MPYRALPLDNPRPLSGVYRYAEYRAGCPVFFAVDCEGNVAGEVVADGVLVTESMAMDFLRDVLTLDPMLSSVVVRALASSGGSVPPAPSEPAPLRRLALLR